MWNAVAFINERVVQVYRLNVFPFIEAGEYQVYIYIFFFFTFKIIYGSAKVNIFEIYRHFFHNIRGD